MIPKTLISAFLVLTLVSCKNNRLQDKAQQETPKALDNNNSSYEIVSSRGYNDLVENLYTELLSKDLDLKRLEEKIDDINNSKTDTIRVFHEFNEKNQSYFSSAERHVSEIKDSLLRDKMKLLIANQIIKYDSQVASHNTLLKVIQSKQMTISDLHNFLKIVRTLPLIDKYQKDNLPGTKSLEGFIKQQEQTIKLADTLSKQ